ncbi:MAG: mannosyltransferase B-like protein [Candidatus Moranbacteria bacterium GW2011_GWE1_49_15]|nr:MAG: mannosyltransferase B-like protein [Candidatus Moranbacteria bacterium GW2011_GWE2_47_10]KKW06648.1 MAG: mannosyltransferase B-like protein [Candidatus Moranbacteria bacterium GW2011_GWE1_49_15]
MKIGIDVRCLIDGKRTGVEEYTIGLLSNLFETDDRNRYVLFLNSFRDPKGELAALAKYKNVSVRRFRIPNKLLNLSFWYLGWPHVDKMLGGVDLFFMPNINFVGLSKKARLVLTMHDISFEHMPEMLSLKRRLWHSFVNPRKLCRRADRIIAVSDSTKNDIVSHYGIAESKVRRIYSGVSEEFTQLDRNDASLVEIKEKYKLPFKFIFFLGTVEPRKNIASLVKAFDHLKDLPGMEKLKLVVAGSRGWKFEKTISAMKQAKHTKDIIFISSLPNKDKNAIYNLASVFAYPSFLEGFGFPVLEAMKCGIPVIASNTSSMPEVVGNEGILIDPEKPDELFTALRSILTDKNLHGHFKERGWRRTVIFSWKSTAREFLNLLEGF